LAGLLDESGHDRAPSGRNPGRNFTHYTPKNVLRGNFYWCKRSCRGIYCESVIWFEKEAKAHDEVGRSSCYQGRGLFKMLFQVFAVEV
jgi:hypothetical protein